MRADGKLFPSSGVSSAAKGRVLVLAGTREARKVLEACPDLDVEASLAGVTDAPDLPGLVRVGGFGGEADFRAAAEGYAAILDATHPFSTVVTERTSRICSEFDLHDLRLTRRPWDVEAGWVVHSDLETCARAIPRDANVFLATGPGGLAPFLNRGLQLWCRRIDPAPPQEGVTWIIGRPGSETAEIGLLRDLGITHLITKNSGGPADGKLKAAKALGLRVHLIERPNEACQGPETHDIDHAIAFVRAHAHHNL
jgi:precorrin-6A/cobalt-precorrin-6A reductase